MHHSIVPFPEDPRINRTFAEHMEVERTFQNQALGATGKFPEGKFNDTDEGEIMCSIGEKKGKVFLSFGAKPIAWIAFSKEQALQIAESLTKFANKLN